MGSFYGNTLSDAAITYDLICPNRKQMEDGPHSVLLGRHILVEYSYGTKPEEEPTDWPESGEGTPLWSNATVYDYNSWIDSQEYSGQNYDSTLWLKTAQGDEVHYVQVASLNGAGFRTVNYIGSNGEEIREGSTSNSTLTFDTKDNNIKYEIEDQTLILSINEIDGGED